MAKRSPARIDDDKSLEEARPAGKSREEPRGARAAAQNGGDPDVPRVGDLAESHHLTHAGSKAGLREDEANVEDHGDLAELKAKRAVA